jgi:hypothetical protein
MVTVRPRGHSMTGKVNDGHRVTVEPLGQRDMAAVGGIRGSAPPAWPARQLRLSAWDQVKTIEP